MGAGSRKPDPLRLGVASCVVLLAGIPLSGPVGFVVVGALAPQPPWTGPERFIEHYHALQAAPFGFGFLLIAGFLALHVAIYESAPPGSPRHLGLLSLAFAAVFG